jgi:hypothetical protein
LLGTLSIDDEIALIALLADTLLGVELLAGELDFAADTLFVEEEPVGALEARVGTPYFAAKVVIKLGKECSIVELSGG